MDHSAIIKVVYIQGNEAGVILERSEVQDVDVTINQMRAINAMPTILPTTTLMLREERMANMNPFEATQSVCNFVEGGVSALISLTSCATNAGIQSLAENLRIPHITISPGGHCRVRNKYEYTLGMVPDGDNIGKAAWSIIKLVVGWKHFIVFYDDDTAYSSIRHFQKQSANVGETIEVIAYRMPDTNHKYLLEDTVMEILQTVRATEENVRFFLICSSEYNILILQKAVFLGMTVAKFEWLMMNTYMPDRLLKRVVGGGGIATVLRETHPPGLDTAGLVRTWNLEPLESQLAIAYTADAIRVLSQSFDNVINRGLWANRGKSSCNTGQDDNYTGSYVLMSELRNLEMVGYSGPISFSNTSYNDNAHIEIINYNIGNQASWTIGHWTPKTGLNLTGEPFQVPYSQRRNSTLRVVTLLENPFVVKDEDGFFKGYCVDLLEYLAADIGFQYEIYLATDNQYGVKDDNGVWNGLVGELAYKKADMAVAGMISTIDRESVVDFTQPYMPYGVSILIHEPKSAANQFVFLQPLDVEVWGAIAIAIVIIGFLLFLITKISPYSQMKEQQYALNLRNSMWFAFASMMQQGVEIAPKSVSSRILGIFWWFFTLIITATYTANLAAFLTVNRLETPITSLTQLSMQDKINYGTVRGSSLAEYFRTRAKDDKTYGRIWSHMLDHEVSSFVDNAEEGYRRVLSGSYAFMWDTTLLDYQMMVNCSLMTVGEPFNKNYYAVALQEGDPFRETISESLLRLQKGTVLEKLEQKWFQGESMCSESSSQSSAQADAIQIVSVAGVFYVLVVGVALSFMTAIGEIVVYSISSRRSTRYEMDDVTQNHRPPSLTSGSNQSVYNRNTPNSLYTMYGDINHRSHDGSTPC